ncbi:aminoimidazole riboside kinase [Sutcliffiella horikoshii]|uniref:Aminoimidazole riboside kinase n=1 Tax=Sutcliffiella horikoshii TaxID=79883 RepID=A0AA95B6H7_9BACI|nr:aminoimidazole riboside kinase [Sutcliffiella horikoshii]TYS59732.1 aminoimidazole riboside kinase [Sutcliffiella horikoshii]
MKEGIISLGEALIDFIPLDPDNISFQKSPGGAPANVAVGVARLEAKSTFIGKVGNDVLGRFLKNTLEDYGVNTSSMLLTDDIRTGVVFVTLENGERSFDFYINPSADRFLTEEEIDEKLFDENKILHFGSISLTSEPTRSATIKAVKLAKEKGLTVSYDPNLRLGLWDSEVAAKEQIISMLPYADILKISEEELEFMTGEKNIEKGADKLAKYDIPLLLVTLGSEGSYVFTHEGHQHVPARKVTTVDTTGAGDAFVSGILYMANEWDGNISAITLEKAVEMATFASVSGSLAASEKGAMTALPSLEQVQSILAK